MSKRIILFFLLFGFTFNGICQQVTVKKLDTTMLLSRLFSATDIKKDPKFGIIGGWKPCVIDSINGFTNYVENNEKHLCYTRIDTILRYADVSSTYAIVVFETFPYKSEGVKETCNACDASASIAEFLLETDSNNNNYWSVQYFNKKFFSISQFGELNGKYSLATLGKKTCLLYDYSASYNSSSEGYKYYYSLDLSQNLKEIFKYQTIRSELNSSDEKYRTTKTGFNLLPNGDIQLKTKEFNGKPTTKLYRYDELMEFYIPVITVYKK